MTICAMVRMLEAAARAAGPDLTRQGLVDATQDLDTTGLPLMLPGSFGRGKTDFTDGLRPVRYSDACHCYEQAGDPIQLDPEP
jgi:hypothetical protein